MNIKTSGLVHYLKLHGYTHLGISNKLNDVNNILNILDINKLNNIFIIGLDGGFIAEYFLINNKNVNVTVFETEKQVYNHISEEYLYITYADRVNIQYSDISTYCNKYRGPKYDLIFINSNRSQKINTEYVNITKNISHSQTNIVMTKTQNNKKIYNGPNKCWNKMIEKCKIKEISSTSKNKKNGLDMSLGIFV